MIVGFSPVSQTRNALLFMSVFALLKLAVDVYQAFYHGLHLHWPSVLFGLVAFCLAGTAGHLIGLKVLRRPVQQRAVPIVAIISYFVAVSLAHLLTAAVTSLPVFLAFMAAVAFVVTVWIGPRWD